MIARPGRHGDANERQWCVVICAVLKGRSDGNVDGRSGAERRYLLAGSIPPPDRAGATGDVPKFRNGSVNGRAVNLPSRNGGMDHVAGRPIHDEANVGTSGRARIGRSV